MGDNNNTASNNSIPSNANNRHSISSNGNNSRNSSPAGTLLASMVSLITPSQSQPNATQQQQQQQHVQIHNQYQLHNPMINTSSSSMGNNVVGATNSTMSNYGTSNNSAAGVNPASTSASTSSTAAMVFMTDPKLLKKTKIIFDEKQKLKIRITTLQSILDSFGNTHGNTHSNSANTLNPNSNNLTGGLSTATSINSNATGIPYIGSEPPDTVRFLREYDSIIHGLIVEYFEYRLDKLRKLREGKSNVSVNQVLQSKEMSEFFKVTGLFRRWMAVVFVPDHLRSNAASGKIIGWKRSIRSILTSLLLVGNHGKIRMEGSRILITLLKSCGHDQAIFSFSLDAAVKSNLAQPPRTSQDSGPGDDDYYFIRLFENIVPLQAFLSPPTSLSQMNDKSGFTIPNIPSELADFTSIALPYPGSPVGESTEMLEDLIQLIESEQPSQFLFELFKMFYMEKTLKALDAGYNDSPELLLVLVRHVSLWLMAENTEFVQKHNLSSLGNRTNAPTVAEATATSNNLNVIQSPKEGSSFSQALQYYLVSQGSGVVCLHELVRRVFTLSFAHAPLILMCLQMISLWISHSRPRFLLFPLAENIKIRIKDNRSINKVVEDVAHDDDNDNDHNDDRNCFMEISSNVTDESELSNAYLQVYITFALSIFDGRSSIGLADEQQLVYSRTLEFYQWVASENACMLEISTWDVLMNGILRITESHLMQANKYSIILSPTAADTICSQIAAVVFYVWTHSVPDRQECWNRLQSHLSGSTRWHNLVIQWSKAMLVLTHKLASYCFDINVADSLTQVQTKSRRGTPMVTTPSDVGVKVTSWKDSIGKGGTNNPKKALLWESLEVLGAPLSSTVANSGSTFPETISMNLDENGVGPGSLINGDFFQFDGPTEVICTRMPFLWENLLCILGNPNRMERPEIHCIAMKCLATVWEVLFETRGLQPYLAQNRPPLFQFLPWLIEACYLPLVYGESKAIAYACLCRMMCRRHEEVLEESYYLHFYRVLIKGLSEEKDDRVTHAILKNSVMIFNLCLPGSLILVPFYVKSCERMLLKGNINSLAMNSSAPADVRLVCIQILASICSICSLYFSMSVPQVKGSGDGEKFSDVKNQVLTIFLNLLVLQSNRTKPTAQIDSQNDIMVLNSMCVIALEELLSDEKIRDNSVFESYLSTLTEHLFFREHRIVSSALDCLSVFLDQVKLLHEISPVCISMCVEKLTTALREHLETLSDLFLGEGTPEIQLQHQQQNHTFGELDKGPWSETICKMIMNLESWAVRSPYAKVMGDSRLRKKIMSCLDSALAFGLVDSQSYHQVQQQHQEGMIATVNTPSSSNNDKKESSSNVTNASTISAINLGATNKSKSMEPLVGNRIYGGVNNDMEACKANIREMAEMAISHLLHNLNYFPTKWGADVFGSIAIEPCILDDALLEDGTLFFCFLDNHIMSLHQVSGDQCRITVRDSSGKFIWDSVQFYEPNGDLENNGSKKGNSPNPLAVPNAQYFSIVSDNVICKEEDIGKDENGEKDEKEEDNLSKMLSSISVVHPDCMSSQCQEKPFERNPLLVGNLVRMESLLRRQLESEISTSSCSSSAAAAAAANNADTSKKLDESSRKKSIASSTAATSTAVEDYEEVGGRKGSNITATTTESIISANSAVHFQVRKFLSQMGFMFLDGFGTSEFCLLNKTTSLTRDIRGLDRKYSREIVKLAVLYVAEGDEDEARILGHSSGSSSYREFVASLGWVVDLSQHAGYTGGLDKSFERAIYYSDSDVEMIFHDVTMLPTDPHDLKQIKKKRHIGNDHVHIIWNEHFRDYKEGTIRGDFGNVQIIVTPQPNSLFAVDLYQMDMIPTFGPLLARSLVTGSVLGPLVRMTALHAYRLTFQITMKTAFKHPYWQRVQDLQTIVSRHIASKCTLETLIKTNLSDKRM